MLNVRFSCALHLQSPSIDMHHTIRLTTLAAAISMTGLAQGQTAPDAGQILQQQQQRLPQLPRSGSTIDLQAPALSPTLPGGQQVLLQSVSIRGATVIAEAALLQALGDVAGRSFDLAGLRALASQVADVYRKAGYPFARAFLPPQPLGGGRLVIEVIEGRYGRVQAEGDGQEDAQRFLQALQPGSVIESRQLERTTLILDDQPGYKSSPIIRPGTEVGSGDLMVRMTREPAIEGSVGADNHGNRYSGYHRLRASANINSPFQFGDQLSLTGLASNENLRLGSVNYSAPLGSSGWRGTLGYAYTSYELGREFAASQTHGTAEVSSVAVSYPLVRSQKSNVTLSATAQHKRLKDAANAQPTDTKSSDSVPLTLQFDHRDGMGGGGITFGSVSWTQGKLQRNPSNDNNTLGSFGKFNLDVIRLQSLPVGFSLYGRVSMQTANRNLDSSEGMVLAGPAGVRAYPVGEASGDEGWLTQLELRYSMGAFAPYAFYDHGRVRTDAKGPKIERDLAGSGVGLRYLRGAWSADMALAWRSEGGRPVDANERDSKSRMWLSASYRF